MRVYLFNVRPSVKSRSNRFHNVKGGQGNLAEGSSSSEIVWWGLQWAKNEHSSSQLPRLRTQDGNNTPKCNHPFKYRLSRKELWHCSKRLIYTVVNAIYVDEKLEYPPRYANLNTFAIRLGSN